MTTDTTGKDPRRAISFVFRGRRTELAGFAPRTTLLDWLRQDAQSTGTKEGCGEGDCGACTVVLSRVRGGRLVHEPVNACILLLGQVDGAEVLTVEDLAKGGEQHPVQDALVRHHGSQCGFCTPGIVMSLFALHQDAPRPVSRDAINDQLAGNLCRCTGYRPIVDAALEVCAGAPADSFAAAADARATAIAAVTDDADVFVGDDRRFFAAPASKVSLGALYVAHPEALILAGATDVGLWITKGLRDPQKIIWVGRVAGLDTIEADDTGLRLGAGVTHADAMPVLARLSPDLGEILRRFGSVQVRASGTVGGSIANGSPIGDLAPCFIALGATLVLQHGDAVRRMPLEDFFLAYRKQDRQPGEFVSAIEIPKPDAASVFRAYKVSKRFDEDISAVLAAVSFKVENRRISSARIAYGGMAGTPSRARNAEGFAVGIRLDDEGTWRGALQALAIDFTPLSDMRASATYRNLVARNLLLKALMELRGAPMSETRLVAPQGISHAAE